jgi:hypothetical protein
MEQRVNVKFCVKLQRSPSETLQMLKTIYGDSIMRKRNGGTDVSEKAEKM